MKKQKWNFGPYTTYLWTLITILITVAVIFVCTYFPGLLWDMTSQSTGEKQNVTLDLPDVEEIISSTVDTNAIPPYFPPLSSVELYPDATYSLVSVTDAPDAPDGPDGPGGSDGVDASGSDAEKINDFSELVVSAMDTYFYLSCSASTIAQHTNLWSVFVEGQDGSVGTYCSTTVVVQEHNHLWTVTAYGSPTALTHLSRTPYSDSDNTSGILEWDSEEIRETIISAETMMGGYGYADEMVKSSFANFLVDSAVFNTQLSMDAGDILEYANYDITSSDTSAQERIYTISFWSDSYGAAFEMVVNVRFLGKTISLWQTMSISQVA